MSCQQRCLFLSQGNSRTEIFGQFFHDRLCQLVEFMGLGTFEKETRFLFGAGISQYDTTLPAQPGFGFCHSLGQAAELSKRQFFPDGDVPEDLWKFVQDLTKLAKRFSGPRHDGHNLQRRYQAVPGGRKISEDEVTTLFSPEVQLVLNHRVDDEPVTHIRSQYLSS